MYTFRWRNLFLDASPNQSLVLKGTYQLEEHVGCAEWVGGDRVGSGVGVKVILGQIGL